MIDLHCHLLPYVDDGANDLEEAEKLLSMEAEQGVTALCLTPHLREGMFETPDAKLQAQFERLSGIAAGMGLRLYLSREYHCDELLWEKIRSGEILPMGRNTLLTEFSAGQSAEQMVSAVERIRRYGFRPLTAHVERYPAADEAGIRRLRQAGALIQVNADAILGRDGRYAKRLAWRLLHAGLVDVVASDAHSTDIRPPRLKACMDMMMRKLGQKRARELLLHNPRGILDPAGDMGPVSEGN